MIILDTEPGWNLVLYLAVAFCAGILLVWSGAKIGQITTWITFLGLLLLILVLGALTRREVTRAWILVYPITLVYIIGWIFFISAQTAAGFRKIWIVFGLILFSALAVVILVRGKSNDQNDKTVSLSSELFLVLFNLYWLSGLVWI